ncbi:MAG: hypothetical protein MUC50_09685 [Myxococcota bacterium]|nr:hypothetical protein [Myxococcota bacterium]
MVTLDDTFEPRLGQFDRAALDSSADSVVGLWPDLTIAYCNGGWHAFAERNGAETAIRDSWGLGRRIVDAVSGPLQRFYEERYLRALRGRDPWHHDYECSSPAQFRKFHSIAYPLKDSAGLLVVHALVEQRPHEQDSAVAPPPRLDWYEDHNGFIHQCGHCRRVQRLRESEQWDWVPSWVAKCPENTSHGLCSLCLDFYYPE